MTRNIRHHTERAHDKAAAQAASEAYSAGLAQIAPQPDAEAAMGAAMASMEWKAGKRPKLPVMHGGNKSGHAINLDVEPEIINVLVRPMRATEIAKAVSVILGRHVRHQTVSDRLHKQLKDKVVRIYESKNNVFWRLK